MSFSIEIYRNNSEENKIGKSLSALANISGTLRDETSIITPSILVEGSISALKGANYMYIPEFGRYYFITNINTVRNGLVLISGRVDVLETYASGILNNKAIIKRQENDWNLYIDDGAFKVYANPIIITREFSNGFVGNEFVLAVAGG